MYRVRDDSQARLSHSVTFNRERASGAAHPNRLADFTDQVVLFQRDRQPNFDLSQFSKRISRHEPHECRRRPQDLD
jgi:hypothetical protein